ncbi:MAG TPA: branched-chain amino acid transaminase [Acidimicrobiales bacterium]|nr:branched-chain amino acid transaminase [Acidimicrobiales bacterium]
MPLTPTAKIWMDGELIDWADAQIHVLTHSLHYGTGVFEGIRAYATANGPAVFRLTDHVTRFDNSARSLMMKLPFSKTEIFEAIKATVRAAGLEACYIRPIAYYGYGDLGLNPLSCEVHVAIAAWPWAAYLGDEAMSRGARVKVSSWARNDPRSVPASAKATGTYINSSLAKVEAIVAGYEEAVMCTTEGYLSECSGENVFVVRRGRLLTPQPSASVALEGVTADSVMTIARDLGYEVAAEALRRTDLYIAEEAFLTGTAAEVVPIASVDDRVIGDGTPGPMTRAIQGVFFKAVRGEVDGYKDWLDYVN